ncbi:MAG: hypothetical protein ACK4Q4_04925 [Rhodocyclaceae bacterium]
MNGAVLEIKGLVVEAGGRRLLDTIDLSSLPLVEATIPAMRRIGTAVQLETLMARGLAPDDAVDRIILGMLR